MDRRILVAALTLLAPVAAAAQAQLGPNEIPLDALTTLSPREARTQGVPLESLRRVEALAASRLAQDPVTFEPGARTGVLIRLTPEGTLTAHAVPTTRPNEILIDRRTVSELGDWRPIDLPGLLGPTPRSARTRLQALIDQTTRTLDPASPATDPRSLPPAWRGRAQQENWTGAAGNYPADCSSSRLTFAATAEMTLLGPDADTTAARPGDERQRLIAAIRDFDDKCLQKVVPGAASSQGLPLGHLAVLSTADNRTFCMAAYLGRGQFLTARHCLYKSGDRLRPEANGATLSMADRSAVRVAFQIPAAQPVASPAPDSSRGDVLLLTASTLPPAVLARNGLPPTAARPLDQALVSPALVIGYFALANPERVIPDGVPRGQLPEWSQALRATREAGVGYCRVWDYTATAADGTACLQHSCQSVPGFSGAPVFVRRGDGSWTLGGIHVSNGDDAAEKQCTSFASNRDGGLLGPLSGLAAAIPATLVQAALSAPPTADH